jgi:hypothetical protein
LGITVLAILFIILSIADVVLAYIEDQEASLIVLACSVLLAYLLRGIYMGQERDRKVGIFLGGLIALMNAFGFFDISEGYVQLHRALYVAEGVFGLAASVYLMRLKESPFFNG